MPAEVLVEQHEPNEETLEAMHELHLGDGKRFSSVAELMADLYDEDNSTSPKISANSSVESTQQSR
jgi:hypothetical protein